MKLISAWVILFLNYLYRIFRKISIGKIYNNLFKKPFLFDLSHGISAAECPPPVLNRRCGSLKQ